MAASSRSLAFWQRVAPRVPFCARERTRTCASVSRLQSSPLSGIHSRSTPIANAVLVKTQCRYKSSSVGSTSSAPVETEDNVLRVGRVKIPNIWLRDNCQCSTCFHADTKQRLHDTFQIPHNLRIRSSESDGKTTAIEWSDGHRSRYDHSVLRQAAAPFKERAIIRQGLAEEPVYWGSEIASSPPKVPHDAPNAMRKILENIRNYGFTYITNVPFHSPTPTEEILTSIAGFLRLTHYGGFYVFTSDLASADTAYTNIALEAHTDTTYFSEPAGLQAFHLLSHTDGEGGASLLVDGFKCALDLKSQDPEAYRILSEVNVHAHASGNKGISIQPFRGFPVFSHDPATGQLLQVRWNSSDRAGIELPIAETPKWYAAARKYNALLKKKRNEYWEQLTPGNILLFDNWRVLHGRSAFTGKRTICGAYVSRDDWVSRWKIERWGDEAAGRAIAAS
ncbi:Trimethyllysine dioxygenase [Westerdykella ornata]|uniref:Trimethyllysine dioxygenase n=1 Tax=Westerdykella ornata TaxID=318751 RepID=A0A6A6JV89_WESOR|nr:Trimethyllysine dioxygenase [Westerdykella ornata]KAF2280155.1 Trimethyllysine dioxygenase [Westerdykella ornata]